MPFIAGDKKYKGLFSSEAKRLKALEEKNIRLNRCLHFGGISIIVFLVYFNLKPLGKSTSPSGIFSNHRFRGPNHLNIVIFYPHHSVAYPFYI